MKKLLTLALVAVLLLPCAALAEWYPFGLTSADDFETAREKVKAATGTEYRETLSYISSSPSNYQLYGLPVNMFLVNRPSGSAWRLTILLNAQMTDYGTLYDIYTELVSRLGEPISVEPMITNTDFDGNTTTASPFDVGRDQFAIDAVMSYPQDYRANFDGGVTYRIQEDSTGITACLYFDNPVK